jgi:hypothetical protein
MGIDDKLALYNSVCQGLEKRPRESLMSAAGRALRHGTLKVRKAASILLSQGKGSDPWERMQRTAEALGGVPSQA